MKKAFILGMIVGLPAVLHAPPCNWSLFSRSCDDHSTDCGFLCSAYEIGDIYGCYTNGSGCCGCHTVYIKCACPWGPKTVYNDTRIDNQEYVCNEDLGKCVQP